MNDYENFELGTRKNKIEKKAKVFMICVQKFNSKVCLIFRK